MPPETLQWIVTALLIPLCIVIYRFTKAAGELRQEIKDAKAKADEELGKLEVRVDQLERDKRQLFEMVNLHSKEISHVESSIAREQGIREGRQSAGQG